MCIQPRKHRCWFPQHAQRRGLQGGGSWALASLCWKPSKGDISSGLQTEEHCSCDMMHLHWFSQHYLDNTMEPVSLWVSLYPWLQPLSSKLLLRSSVWTLLFSALGSDQYSLSESSWDFIVSRRGAWGILSAWLLLGWSKNDGARLFWMVSTHGMGVTGQMLKYWQFCLNIRKSFLLWKISQRGYGAFIAGDI